jgi:hypothetical protein
MIASFIVSLIAFKTIPQRFAAGDPRADSIVMLITVVVSTIAWLTVTFLTQPEPDSVLDSFYRRVRPGGSGWRRVAERAGFGAEGIEGGIIPWTNWIAGIVAVYSSLFGIGKLIFGQTLSAVILFAIAAAAFMWISRSFRRMGGSGESERSRMAREDEIARESALPPKGVSA